MTQTVKGQDNMTQKQTRPGQRQQDRILRKERRRRRIQIWVASIIACVLIIGGVVGLIQYQQTINQQTETANRNATATANAQATVNVHATATGYANAMLTATSGSPTPASGPATPPSVTATPVNGANGLQYIDTKVGPGPQVQQNSTVKVQYTGWLQSNGQKFDSSYDRNGEAFEVQLGQGAVIPGWDQGLVGMHEGGTRRLIVPPALAYGAQGSPPTIPPDATLIFDVTVVTVQQP